MKSKTSYFDAAVFRKNLTRFAPAWVLYSVLLVMSLLLMMEGEYWFIRNVADSMSLMAILNLGYGAVVAQLLFGDLYNTRMCNALHALPLRRETWFGTNLISAVAFSLVPNLLTALIGTAVLGQYWYVGLAWLCSSMLQYFCCFGIAVFSVFCAGNRFAMLLVYGIINFFAFIGFWMVDTLYQPLLYGIHLDLEWFTWLMPVYPMAMIGKCVSIHRFYDERTLEYVIDHVSVSWAQLGILALYAAIGLALMAVALVLYRRRKLEVAGDFIAVKALEPVFLVLYTLCAGVACQLLPELFGYSDSYYIYLTVGLAVGFFTGLMLLQRKVRVFEKKAVLRFVALVAIVLASLGLTWLDPIGITRWVPDVEEVESVTVWDTHYFSTYDNFFTVEDPADIQLMLNIHQTAVDNKNGSGFSDSPADVTPYAAVIEEKASYATHPSAGIGSNITLTLQYRLKNGREVCRYYNIFSGGPSGQALLPYFSAPETVLRMDPVDIDAFAAQFLAVSTNDTYFTGNDIRALAEAIVLDCRAGNMAQVWEYHTHEDTAYWLNFEYTDPISLEYMRTYLELRVYPSSENTYQWLQDHGALTDQEYYGYE